MSCHIHSVGGQTNVSQTHITSLSPSTVAINVCEPPVRYHGPAAVSCKVASDESNECWNAADSSRPAPLAVASGLVSSRGDLRTEVDKSSASASSGTYT
jgi:hypothetical protein